MMDGRRETGAEASGFRVASGAPRRWTPGALDDRPRRVIIPIMIAAASAGDPIPFHAGEPHFALIGGPMPCPFCGFPDDVRYGDHALHVAHCEGCLRAFRWAFVDEAAPAASPPRLMRVPDLAAPRGVRVESGPAGDALCFAFKWSANPGWFAVLLLPIIFLSVFAWDAFFDIGWVTVPRGGWGAVIIAAVLAVLAYVAACCFFNRTRIILDGERLESRAGPLPLRPPRRVRLPDLSAVRCRVRMIQTRSGRYALHDFVAVRADGRALRLVSDQPSPECTLFVRQEILKRLAEPGLRPRADGVNRGSNTGLAEIYDEVVHAALGPIRTVAKALVGVLRGLHAGLRGLLVPELRRASSPRHARVLMHRAYLAVSRARPVGRFLLFVLMCIATVLLLGAGMHQLSKLVPEPDSIWTGLPYGFAVLILLAIPGYALVYVEYLLLFRREVRATLLWHLGGDSAALCSKCGYDLRGQVERRCPECGTPMPARLCPLGEPRLIRATASARP